MKNGTLESRGGRLLSHRVRAVIGMIFMLDLLRRLIDPSARPIDLWLFIIEFLVLFIIGFDFVWDRSIRVSTWLDVRRKRAAFRVDLNKLTFGESRTLCELVSTGIAPALEGLELQMKLGTHVIDRGHVGWYICQDYKDLVRDWCARPVTPPQA